MDALFAQPGAWIWVTIIACVALFVLGSTIANILDTADRKSKQAHLERMAQIERQRPASPMYTYEKTETVPVEPPASD